MTGTARGIASAEETATLLPVAARNSAAEQPTCGAPEPALQKDANAEGRGGVIERLVRAHDERLERARRQQEERAARAYEDEEDAFANAFAGEC